MSDMNKGLRGEADEERYYRGLAQQAQGLGGIGARITGPATPPTALPLVARVQVLEQELAATAEQLRHAMARVSRLERDLFGDEPVLQKRI